MTLPPECRPDPLARAIKAHRDAEAELNRLASAVEALANEWSGPESHRANAWVRERDAADRLRSALRSAGSRIETTAASDGRECGWMGCGHPRCADLCTAVPLAEWEAWRAKRHGLRCIETPCIDCAEPS